MQKIIFLTGASGSGKTTVVKAIQLGKLLTMQLIHSDDFGIPSPETMVEKYGGGIGFQEHVIRYWIKDILTSEHNVPSILEGSFRPSIIVKACKELGIKNYQIILFDCDNETRAKRLDGRGHPELATKDMMEYAAILRDQAINDKPTHIIDTSSLSADQTLQAFLRVVDI